MSDPAPEAAPDLNNLWMVDRSRVQAGRIRCRRYRYREYHSGPTGYGIRRTAQSLPLVTGLHTHEILADLLSAVVDTGELPNDENSRGIINKSADAYRQLCADRGFLELPDADDAARAEVQRVTMEQSALIEALGWAARLVWLPALLEQWEPVVVERECLLSLGESSVLMSRPDLIARRRIDGALAQFEFKTVGGWIQSAFWRKQWEDSAQLMLTKLNVEANLGEPVSLAYVFALDKGPRSKEKSTDLLKQWSFFLYAYHREAKAANPPMVKVAQAEDWQLRWKYQGEDGKGHTLGKAYRRTETFTFDFAQRPAGMSPVEFWVRSLPPEEVMTQHEILGPYDFLTHSQDSILESLKVEEAEWRERLWQLYSVGEACGWDESHPDFVRALDTLFPQSWNCHAYGKDCQFLPICRREPSWPAPHEDERFETRRPHHEAELQQMIARGIEPPLPQDADDPSGGEG